jgi:hypothetical protein
MFESDEKDGTDVNDAYESEESQSSDLGDDWFLLLFILAICGIILFF